VFDGEGSGLRGVTSGSGVSAFSLLFFTGRICFFCMSLRLPFQLHKFVRQVAMQLSSSIMAFIKWG
jgi:hypothetical protein